MTSAMDSRTLELLLDSWNKPVVFVDTDHRIRYMNRPARRHYAKWGDVIGKSIFDCHNSDSRRTIESAFRDLAGGAREVLISSSRKHRVYMRAVRKEGGELIGYYERYGSPSHEEIQDT